MCINAPESQVLWREIAFHAAFGVPRPHILILILWNGNVKRKLALISGEC
jgi:hypothetical protein